MSSSRFFASPLDSHKPNSSSHILENRAYDIVQRLTVYRNVQPEEIALEIVLTGASSLTNAAREANILGIINSGFFKTLLGHIGNSLRFEVIAYIGKIFEYFWSTECTNGKQINSLKGVSGRALCALIGKLTAMEYLPYGHFQALVCQLVTQFRSKEHLDCLLVMLRHAASLPAEYFTTDERFLLSVTKVLCIRSSAAFGRGAPEVAVRISNLIHRVLLKRHHLNFYLLDSDDDDNI